MHVAPARPALFCADCLPIVSSSTSNLRRVSPPARFSLILNAASWHLSSALMFHCLKQTPIDGHDKDTQMNQWLIFFCINQILSEMVSFLKLRTNFGPEAVKFKTKAPQWILLFQEGQNISIYSISNCIMRHLFIQHRPLIACGSCGLSCPCWVSPVVKMRPHEWKCSFDSKITPLHRSHSYRQNEPDDLGTVNWEAGALKARWWALIMKRNNS